MTIREYLKAETSDKRINISAVLTDRDGEIVTYEQNKHEFIKFYSKTSQYRRFINRDMALNEAGDALDRDLYQATDLGAFIALDYKVAME